MGRTARTGWWAWAPLLVSGITLVLSAASMGIALLFLGPAPLLAARRAARIGVDPSGLVYRLGLVPAYLFMIAWTVAAAMAIYALIFLR